MQDDRRWIGLNNPYRYRNDNLLTMGFKSYRSYLSSALWASIRVRVFDRAGGRCEKCRKPATQVHHRAYDPSTLRGENINALTAACGRCHERAEKHQKAASGETGQAAYQRLQKANGALFKRRRSGFYRDSV